MLISAVIDSAMRKISAVASGEDITSDEQTDALEALQVMLRSWSAEGINIFTTTEDSGTLSSGTASYTCGSSGDIDTVRPNKVIGAYVLDSDNISHSVEIIPVGKYNAIANKTLSARPYYLYPEYGYPLVTLTLFPVPSAAETLYIESIKPFTETSSFDAVDSTLAMPAYYQEPIIYNLAVRLAPEFGKAIPPTVAAIAISSYDRLMILNASNRVEPINIQIPAGRQGSYNVNTDSYR